MICGSERPSRAATVLGDVPAIRDIVAEVCRKSCGVRPAPADAVGRDVVAMICKSELSDAEIQDLLEKAAAGIHLRKEQPQRTFQVALQSRVRCGSQVQPTPTHSGAWEDRHKDEDADAPLGPFERLYCFSRREGRTDLVRLSSLHSAAAISAAAVFLSACSTGTQSSSAGLLPTLGSQNHKVSTGIARYPGTPSAILLRKLYVTDINNSDVAVFRHSNWASLGTITNGVKTPYGDWVDRNGNLYVANRTSPTSSDVTEYDSSGNLLFTYNTGLKEAVSVTTDAAGNVYEADQSGTVTEFAQGSNVVTASCTLPYETQALGIAVDKHHDVFVTFDALSSVGGILVYPGGLSRGSFTCASTRLPIRLDSPAGAAFDTHGNLVVCDVNAQAVDIIAPPYKSITSTLGSGFVHPFFATIDKAGTEAYVTDAGAANVQVLTYPGGTNVETLGSANGLGVPLEAVDSKNYVP